MTLNKACPELLLPFGTGSSGIANALGAGQACTCQYHLGRAGLGLLMPLGPDIPLLVDAIRLGQVWTCQCPWGHTGLDLTMPMGHGAHRSGLANAMGTE